MEEEKIVILKDENGKNIKFVQLMTFQFEDSLYVAITPQKEIDGIENGEVMILEVQEDDDETDCYLPLENEQVLQRVWEEFEEIYND